MSIATWSNLQLGTVGVPAVSLLLSQKFTMQVSGTFGAGGTLQLQASADGVLFQPVRYALDAPVLATALGIWGPFWTPWPGEGMYPAGYAPGSFDVSKFSFVAPGSDTVASYYVRPAVVNGDATTSLTVVATLVSW